MSVSIITGYTGERHITPYMDAAVNRSIFGEDGCILATGNQMSASMPTINSFVIADGAFSIQGHIGVTNGETLAVDTCATGSNRIDLVVARFTHNATTLIDGLEIVLVKGTETTSAYPTTPTINTGVIANGATTVDLALYQINLSGSTVTFSRVAELSSASLGDIVNPVGGMWKDARDNAGIKVENNNSNANYIPVVDMKTDNYDFSAGVYRNQFYVSAVSNTDYNNSTNSKVSVAFDPSIKALNLDGMLIGQYSVLWTGAWYMTAGQTANLSKSVKAQPHGIVLAWSGYSNGQAQNYNWVYKFVPKWHVYNHNGAGIAMPMANADFSVIGSKYVYVSDSKITGSQWGTSSGTRNGVTFNNANWVLRAVIGV